MEGINFNKPHVVRKIGSSIIGGDFTGNARGTNALDLQPSRSSATQVASGGYATAVGRNNTASGLNSLASGYDNLASGERTVAIGMHNTASNYYSVAAGYGNDVSGMYSIGIGKDNTVAAYWASAIGVANTINTVGAYYALAAGYLNTVSNMGSTGVGNKNSVTGDYAVAVGSNNTVSGIQAIASGYNNDALALKSCAFGYANVMGVNSSGCVGVGVGNSVNLAVADKGTSVFGYYNTVSAYRATVAGYKCTVSSAGSLSTIAGYYASVSATKASAFGFKAQARITKTINFGGGIITRKDNGESAAIAFESFGGVENAQMTKEIDFTATGAQTITIPSGASFFPTKVALICTDCDGTLTTQPTVEFGITGTTGKIKTGALSTLMDTAKEKELYDALLSNAGEATLVANITSAAVLNSATVCKGRAIFYGILIEDE